MRILIVGATPSHLAAAARLRRLDEAAKIIVIDEAGESAETAILRRRYRIELRSFTRFVSADIGYSNVATLEDMLTRHVYQEEFDKILNEEFYAVNPQFKDITAPLDNYFDADIAAHLLPYAQGGNMRLEIRNFGGISGNGREMAEQILGRSMQAIKTVNLLTMDISALKLAFFGETEKSLNAAQKSHIYSALPIAGGFLKLIYDDMGSILGFAALGERYIVENCTDIMTTLVKMGGTIRNMIHLELTGNDNPITTLGKIAQNVIEKRVFMAYADEIKRIAPQETILLDVRHQLEFMDYHIGGSINIPLEALRDSIYRLERTKEIITICGDGKESYPAARILMGHGYKTRYLTGGLAYARPIIDPPPQFYPREVL